jgi:hypothetical protein
LDVRRDLEPAGRAITWWIRLPSATTPMVEISITHARDLDSFDGSVKYAKTFSMLRSIISVSFADGFACSLRRMPLSALRRMTHLVRLAVDGPLCRPSVPAPGTDGHCLASTDATSADTGKRRFGYCAGLTVRSADGSQ